MISSITLAPPAKERLQHQYRALLYNALNSLDKTAGVTPACSSLLATLHMHIANDFRVTGDEYLGKLCQELTGEIAMALSDQFYYVWGCHYLRSLSMAHYMQMTNNFKDHAVQCYGQIKYHDLREHINTIFNSLPAPEIPEHQKHLAIHGIITGLETYNTASNGCFAHDSVVFASKDPFTAIPYPIPVSSLRVGDYIATAAVDSATSANIGAHMARVSHITVMKHREPFPVVKFVDSGLIITPWHPIKMHYRGKWEFPATICKNTPDLASIMMYEEDVYDIAVEDADYACVQNMIVATLGHHIRDDPVASHAYFGSQYILQDLDVFGKDVDGKCVIYPHNVVRNVDTLAVISYR